MATLPPIRIVFTAVDRMSRQTREMTQSLRMVSTAANRAGMAMTAAFTIPIVTAGANAIRTLADTSKAYNTMRANTTQGDTPYDNLRKSAIEFAGTSQRTTGEVIDAMTELGRAGRNTDDIISKRQPKQSTLSTPISLRFFRKMPIGKIVKNSMGQSQKSDG